MYFNRATLTFFASVSLTATLTHADILHLARRQDTQTVFPQLPLNRLVSHPSDPAGHPNVVARIEVTSNGSHTEGLYCAREEDEFESGFVHYTNNAGEESEHMFWWLFKARHDPENAPVVMTFGGGPGASGMLFPFSGTGPCMIKVDEKGHGRAEASPYPWTEYVNLLAIDHPIGVGFSYGTHFRNSSATAAWDVDDFLQEFWKKYPHLVKNEFMMNGGSYGGTFLPNVIDVIHKRNLKAKSNVSPSRIIKMPESIMMVNIWSDPLTHFRWIHESTCNPDPDGNMFFNATLCDEMVRWLPECLDSLQYTYEQPSLSSKMDAFHLCVTKLGKAWEASPERDPYDFRTRCPPNGCDIALDPVGDVLNSTLIKDTVGVPHSARFDILNDKDIAIPFITNGDMIQPAYLLLAPAIEDGMRLFVYNGMQDGVAPWRSSLAWMRLLKTKYQTAFRNMSEVEYPGVGSIYQVGSGAGNYTLIKIREAGHMVIRSQPELLRHIMIRWLKNEPFF